MFMFYRVKSFKFCVCSRVAILRCCSFWSRWWLCLLWLIRFTPSLFPAALTRLFRCYSAALGGTSTLATGAYGATI